MLVSASMISYGQRNVRFGVMGGMTRTITDSHDEEVVCINNKDMFHIRAFVDIALGNGFYLQPGLQYIEKTGGIGMRSGDDIIYIAPRWTSNFIEIPVQIQWGKTFNKIKPYCFAEPFIGYNLNPKGQTNPMVGIVGPFEGGLGLGAGIELFKHVQISARYSWNFGHLFKADYREVGKGGPLVDKATTACLMLSGAVMF